MSIAPRPATAPTPVAESIAPTKSADFRESRDSDGSVESSSLSEFSLPLPPDRSPYQPPFWLPGGHLQTIVPALWLSRPHPPYTRERWTTPDDDFIDLDWLNRDAANVTNVAQRESTPLLVLFHGLEGSSDSHYARSIMHMAQTQGWCAVIPHFRSCSGEMNRAPRFYHSGDATEIDWILRRIHRTFPDAPLFVAGVSLGGNALLRWLGENATDAANWIGAAAAISAPVDLHAGGQALSRGFNRVYTRHFLQTLKQKSLAKLAQFPGLFDRKAMLAAQDLHSFDDVVTAPLHGFKNADDYWTRASAKPILPEISVPTLLLNARNDPFLPQAALPAGHQVSNFVTLDQPSQGGHVGFAQQGGDWLAQRLLAFLRLQRSV